MPRRYPASASADASRPSIVAHDADTKVLEALDRCSQPLKLSAGANFAFVLALKRWAARARERLASRSKRPKKKRKGPAASSVLSKRLEFHGLRTIEIIANFVPSRSSCSAPRSTTCSCASARCRT